MMKRSVMELKQHLNGLAYLEIANIHAASSAMGELGAKAIRNTTKAQKAEFASANAWRQLFETVIGYGDAILRNPNSQNHRRINTNLGNFKKKIGVIPNGIAVVVALGFQEDSIGSMALPGDVNINAFRARLIELKAALATISKFAAKEMIISKNSTSKARAVSKKTKQNSKKNVSKTAVSQKANDRKKNKGNTIHHENSAKVDILKQEVLQLKEQLSSLAEPRDIDTIERMPPSERKKMEKSADKIGMKLKAGKNKSAPNKDSRRSKTSGKRNQKSTRSSDVNTIANSKKSEKQMLC